MATTAGSAQRTPARTFLRPGSRNWAGAAAGGGTQIELLAPPMKTWPRGAMPAASGWTRAAVPTRPAWCSRCIARAATLPGAATLAVAVLCGRADIDEAYAAAQTKINLDNPASVAPGGASAR